MPITPTYPGVYVEEIPSGVRTIVGVSTSDTAFVDFFRRGPMNEAVRITSFPDFERVFGGLDTQSEASYALQQYYLNGGQVAWVVRVAGGTPRAARRTLQGSSLPQDTLRISAISPGLWGEHLQVAIDTQTRDPLHLLGEFNLVVREVVLVKGQRQVVNSEVHRNLSMDKNSSRYAISVVNTASALVQLTDLGLGAPPSATGGDVTSASVIGNPDAGVFVDVRDAINPADDGTVPDSTALQDGMFALDKIEPFIFSLLCVPAAANLPPSDMVAFLTAATKFCEDKRAFLIVDIPSTVNTLVKMTQWINDPANASTRHRNAAVYFPRLEVADALNEFRPRNTGASGTLAGVYARTDATRGVWKAPAGTDASLRGVNLAVKMNDQDNGAINQWC